jgi:hypothetical protein
VGLTLGVLWLLASLDAAFCGYRAAAGRSRLIRKRAYDRSAVLRGLAWGQAAVLLTGGAAALALAIAPQPDALLEDLLAVGWRMVLVYGPCALAIAVAFLLRVAPSVDVRSITSTLLFGPLTLARPAVIVGGLAFGVGRGAFPVTWALASLAAAAMLLLEPFLGRAYREAAGGGTRA